jgi:hypothetical protein
MVPPPYTAALFARRVHGALSYRTVTLVQPPVNVAAFDFVMPGDRIIAASDILPPSFYFNDTDEMAVDHGLVIDTDTVELPDMALSSRTVLMSGSI